MKIRSINKENFISVIAEQNRPWQENYLAMYASQWRGATSDPDLMLIPIDDHLVHRGDGVFDVMRCVRGNIYQMEAHLRRLERSAKAISLDFPPDYDDIREIIKDLVLIGGEKDCLIRVILSRGPGSFTTNPYDCPFSQTYVNIIRFREKPGRYYKEGISLITSKIPVKKSFFANIKSCNYLPNVLMKKEAIAVGCPYSVALDENGFLAEGSTENVAVLTTDGILKFPEFDRILSGITANRLFKLANELIVDGVVKGVEFANITQDEAYRAGEMFLTGTSLGILPVVGYDGKRIGNGSPGSVYAKLSSLLWRDMTENGELLTRLDWKS